MKQLNKGQYIGELGTKSLSQTIYEIDEKLSYNYGKVQTGITGYMDGISAGGDADLLRKGMKIYARLGIKKDKIWN